MFKHWTGPSPAVLTLAVLICGTSMAQPLPTVAAHPLVLVESSTRRADELQALLGVELAKLRIKLVGSSEVRDVLHRLPSESCAPEANPGVGHDSCLVALANGTGALYSLRVTLAPDAPKMVGSARVLRSDGTVVRIAEGREFPRVYKHARLAEAQAAFRKLLAELDLPSLPPALPVPELEPAPLMAAQPDPAPPHPVSGTPSPTGVSEAWDPARPYDRLRLGAYVAAGVAGVTAATSLGFHLSARSDSDRLRPRLDEGRLRVDDPEGAQLSRRIKSKDAATTGFLIGTGVAVAVSAALWYLSIPTTPSSAVRLSVTPTPDGAVAFVGGSLP